MTAHVQSRPADGPRHSSPEPHGQQFLPGERRLHPGDPVVVFQPGQARRLLHRILEVAELVDEPGGQRIIARPHPPLGNAIYLLEGPLPLQCNVRHELAIGTLDARLQHACEFRIEVAIRPTGTRERRGPEAVRGDADLGQRLREGREHDEHADGSGDGHRRGHDAVGRRGDVVGRRGGHRSHRGHHGLAGIAQRRDLATDLLGCEHAAAGAVDAQHHRQDRVVVARIPEQRGQALTADRPRWLLAVQDLAGGDDHADVALVAAVQGRLRAQHAQVRLPADRVVGVLALVAPGLLADPRVELLPGLQAVDQAATQRELRQVAIHLGEAKRSVVGIGLQRRGFELAGAGHVALPAVPQLGDPDPRLLAILGRHVGTGECLRRGLVGTDLEHVHLHAELVGGALEVLAEVAIALDQHRAEGIEVGLVGMGRDIELPLVVVGAPGEYLLARRTKPAERRADVVQGRQPGTFEAAQVEHQCRDAAVVGRRVDDLDEVGQAGLRPAFTGGVGDHPVERVAAQFLDDVALQGHDQRSLRREIGQRGAAGGKQDAEQHQQHDQVQDLAQAVEPVPQPLEERAQHAEERHGVKTWSARRARRRPPSLPGRHRQPKARGPDRCRETKRGPFGPRLPTWRAPPALSRSFPRCARTCPSGPSGSTAWRDGRDRDA